MRTTHSTTPPTPPPCSLRALTSFTPAPLAQWRPLSLPLQLPANSTIHNADLETDLHGPLPGCVGGALRFLNPAVGIQCAPFAVTVDMPNEVKVATPMTVTWRIKNESKLHQHVAVEMDDVYDSSIVMSGMKQGSLHFGPHEERELRFTAVFLLPGKTRLPALRCVSRRSQSFVVGGAFLEENSGAAGATGSVFVSP